MGIFQAIVMGIVQGLTEFLPVSSSGHLSIFKNILGVETDTGLLFDVLLHVATLVAVFIAFYKDVIRLIVEFLVIVKDGCINLVRFFKNLTAKNKQEYIDVTSTSYKKFVIMLLISTLVTGVIGVLLKDVVDSVSSNLLVTGICLLGTGVILILSDYIAEGHKKPKDAGLLDAAGIGAVQGVATLPGISRSGSTIVACMLFGFDRRFAVKYSFIMSMPAILGAMILEIKDVDTSLISGSDVLAYIIGMIFAGAVGYVAVKLMVKVVLNKYFKYFAFYCFAIGAISVIAYIVML
ncbi:MAG: undecaprenyl-diphosphate phosphatase [Lachnospiraceae bacterium]|nr:undecaprenyl-diphosphate phosphatase [Lachnospiraceae bacterium]